TSGIVQERYVEDPFGKVSFLGANWSSQSASSVAWVYLHQGSRFSTTTGLYNDRNRDYSPALQIWVSPDPLGYAAGDANFVRYVGNGPTNLTDPGGLQWTRPTPGGGIPYGTPAWRSATNLGLGNILAGTGYRTGNGWAVFPSSSDSANKPTRGG